MVNSNQFPSVELFSGDGIFVQCRDGYSVDQTPEVFQVYRHVPGICAKIVCADPPDAQL